MQAFWLNYDSAITQLDGADAAQIDTIGQEQIVPLVAGKTQLNVINPNTLVTTVTVHIFGDDGELAPPYVRQLPSAGAFQAGADEMFPETDLAEARYFRMKSSNAPIASSAVVRSFLVPVESAVLNGENIGSRTELTFPHVINGKLGASNYTTVIGVTNVSSNDQTVTLTFTPSAGDPISVTRDLAGSGSLRETAQALFGLPSAFQSGWVQVRGTTIVTGFAAYADTVAGGLAVVPAGTAQVNLFFSHIADGPPQWQTGLALLNPGSTEANVEVYAMDPSGALIGGALNVDSAAFTLKPFEKVAKAIHELIPSTLGVNGGYVYVRTTNNVPLYGIELFYSQDLKVLSNVAAGRLLTGLTFTPPSP
jgi:hypothetical protein